MRSTVLRALSLVLAGTVAHPAGTSAAAAPGIAVRTLVATADLVAMGTIVAISDVGATSVEVNTRAVPGRSKSAVLAADQILKGQAAGQITIQFTQTDFFVGYPGIGAGQYRIFFLKRQGEKYEFTSPYYPSVPAICGSLVTDGDPLARVLDAEAQVVRSGEAPSHLKREAMHYLQEIDASSPVSVGAFRSALDDGDQTVRLTATASLLHGDQIDVLPIAEAALLRPDDSDWVTNMRVAIRDKVRIDRSTLPVLERLFAGGDVETRRAIARAVRRGHSAVALKILRVALDDRDIDVKYNAVMSLAHIAGQPEHGISRIAFSANPHKYTEYWKEWLRNRSHVWRLGNHEEDAAVTVNGVPPSDSGVHVVSVIGEPA